MVISQVDTKVITVLKYAAAQYGDERPLFARTKYSAIIVVIFKQKTPRFYRGVPDTYNYKLVTSRAWNCLP
jgi:hypothetical protein